MLLAFGGQEANAQAVLNKLKQKAENAIGAAISEKLGDKSGNTQENSQVEAEAEEHEPAESVLNQSDGKVVFSSPDKQLERRRSSSFGWTETVTPSTAEFPVPLMNEFPKVPSAEELADPTEEKMIAYYHAIKKVTMRAEELNADTTCEDEFSLEWREKQANKIAAAFGLTRAEFDALENNTLSDSEREALEAKMVSAMFGGVDMQAAAAKAQARMDQMQGTGAEEAAAMMEKNAINAIMKVYEADPAETKYVTGKTPAELRKIMSQPEPDTRELDAYEKKMKAQDGASYSKRAEAMKKKVMAASQNAMKSFEGTDDLMEGLANARNFEDKLGVKEYAANASKFAKATQPMYDALAAGSDIDAKFSAAERKKVEDIKTKIYSTDDPSVYNPLYLQALEAIKTYRLRAAGLWSADVQKRFDNVKNEMPAFIKVMREEAAAEFIPECGIWRAPLNVVIEAGDILEEAYSEFPSDYPPMYKEEVIRKVTDALWWPEFFVAARVDDVISGKYLYYVDENGDICQEQNGKLVKVGKDFNPETLPGMTQPESAVWKSSDGKREVIYNAKGQWLQLPEGDVVYPVAIQKFADKIVWITHNAVETDLNDVGGEEEERHVYGIEIVKCTYKL